MAKNETQAQLAEQAGKIQREKAEANRSRKRAALARKQDGTAPEPVATSKTTEEASLHALFSAARKVISDNHVSRDPALILRNSKEMRKAHAFHGHETCLRRVYDAAIKSGMSEETAAKFATKACA